MASPLRTPEDDADLKEERRRRLKAARAYAGLTVKQLADEIQRRGHARGYSAENINLMERQGPPGRFIQVRDFRIIAEACGVSPAFFTVDFARLDDAEQAEPLAERLVALESSLTKRIESLEDDLLELTRGVSAAALARAAQESEASSGAASGKEATGRPRRRSGGDAR